MEGCRVHGVGIEGRLQGVWSDHGSSTVKVIGVESPPEVKSSVIDKHQPPVCA